MFLGCDARRLRLRPRLRPRPRPVRPRLGLRLGHQFVEGQRTHVRGILRDDESVSSQEFGVALSAIMNAHLLALRDVTLGDEFDASAPGRERKRADASWLHESRGEG